MADSRRTRNTIKNIIYGMINKLVSLLLSLLNRYVFLLILPVEYLGINGVFTDVLVMLSLADLGMATAMAYSFYKPLAENDEKKLTALLTFYRKIYNCIALIVAVAGICMLPFLEYIINVDYEIPHLHLYYLISLFNTVISYLFAYKQSVISADQKYYIISKYSMWIAFAKIILQILVLYISHSYILYLAVGIFTTVAYNLLVNHQANKYYPFIRKRAKLDKGECAKIFENIKSIFIYKVSNIVMSGTDNTLISVIVGTVSVGLYTNYLTVINRIVQFSVIFFGSFTAGIGNLIANKEQKKSYQIFKEMQLCSFWIAGYISTAVYFLIEDFIKLWLGESFIMSQAVLAAILCNVFYDIVKQPVLSFREATGMYKNVRYIMLVCAVVNIMLSIFMGIRYGVSGIVIASFLSKLLTSFWYEAVILYRDYFKTDVKTYFIETVLYSSVCLLIGYICSFIMKLIEVNGIFTWILKGIMCTLIVNVMYLAVYIKNPNFKSMVKRVIKR